MRSSYSIRNASLLYYVRIDVFGRLHYEKTSFLKTWQKKNHKLDFMYVEFREKQQVDYHKTRFGG